MRPVIAPDQVRQVAVVGAGVIGGGWVPHFLRMGLDVVVHDPSPNAEKRVLEILDLAWPTMERLGLRDGASRDRLLFEPSLEAAVANADVIQESSPERLAAKQDLFARLDDASRPDAVIISSTSGLRMTDIQAQCARPERTVIGHPFNPPYLVPLVEVVGGELTDPDVVDWTVAFFDTHGKCAIKMDMEVLGLITSRIQEAMWREMLHMVAEGEATVEQIDKAIVEGPGLRWAIMGPALTFHLAGGRGGIAHTLDQFEPALKEPWSRLVAPDLTDELRQRVIDGCEREAAGRSVDEMAAARDACLVEIMEVRERWRDKL